MKESEVMYIAHLNEQTGCAQSVKEHNENVAALCESFSIPPLKQLCFAIGNLHDIGKYCNAFQRRIKGENIHVDHSTAGAVVMQQQYQLITGILGGLCIAGHHAGIPDTGLSYDGIREDAAPTLYARIAQKKKRCEKDPEENFAVYKNETTLPDIDETKIGEFVAKDCRNSDEMIDKISFLTRYCFSCLVDADSIDTGMFCGTKTDDVLQAEFQKCLERVNKHINKFVCETQLQKARRRLQEQAFAKSNKDAEIYLMNMPTGSGKTICSVKFALQRAMLKDKKRIIYVIPYNNIIDQTASEFEEIFGEDAQILRHQSSFSYEDREDLDQDYRNALRNGIENWDSKFIITTAVQFFESLHANKRGKLRKIHNIADSVLVFDEAHLMPMNYLQPCLQAVSYVTKYLNSEALFLTATMPDFEELLKRYTLADPVTLNLIDETKDFKLFDKCEFRTLGEISDEELLEKVKCAGSALIVTNSKKAARTLYELASGKKYYLSTYLTAVDRKRLIDEIRDSLKKLETEFPNLQNVPEEQRVRVFSTSLIEAGVDLDFETVFRELSGLDNVLQSGGRCNREGKRKNAVTYTFSFLNEDLRSKLTEASELTKGMFEKYESISDANCIRAYYERLFGMNHERITGKTMSYFCRERQLDFRSIPFRSYAENFHLIDEQTESVVIPQDDSSRKLIDALKYQTYVSNRKLQKYTCTVSKRELEELRKQKVIEDYGSGIWCLTNENYYDENTGIHIELTDYFL